MNDFNSRENRLLSLIGKKEEQIRRIELGIKTSRSTSALFGIPFSSNLAEAEIEAIRRQLIPLYQKASDFGINGYTKAQAS